MKFRASNHFVDLDEHSVIEDLESYFREPAQVELVDGVIVDEEGQFVLGTGLSEEEQLDLGIMWMHPFCLNR